MDLSKVSGYAAMSSLTVSGQNGAAVGKLESYTLGNDGSLIGSFSNGIKQVLAKIALGQVHQPGGPGEGRRLVLRGHRPTPAACSWVRPATPASAP